MWASMGCYGVVVYIIGANIEPSIRVSFRVLQAPCSKRVCAVNLPVEIRRSWHLLGCGKDGAPLIELFAQLGNARDFHGRGGRRCHQNGHQLALQQGVSPRTAFRLARGALAPEPGQQTQ